MRVLVVIVCYRVPDLTIDCLRSLSGEVSTLPDVKVAICENGTGPESAEQLRAAIEDEGWSGWARLEVIHPNRGFAGGNNVILRAAMNQQEPPDAFLLLNADTLVRPGALAALIEALRERPDVGIVSPRIEWPDGTPQVKDLHFITPLSEMLAAAQTGPLSKLLARHVVSREVSDKAKPSEWVSFACALLRRELIEDIGLLDEGYYLYFDDVDYCQRAWNAGWQVLTWPAARIAHLHGRSNPVPSLTDQRKRRPRYYYVSRSRYFAKHYGIAGLWMANLCWMAGRTISLGRELVRHKQPHTCSAQWRDNWTNWHRPLQSPIQATSTCS